MLTPFRLGLGGRVGSGNQYWSWVSIDDVVFAVLHALQRPDLAGAANVVAPSPVTNLEFTRVLAGVLHRPAVLPMPAFAVRAAFGQMGDELLLASARVVPGKLQASGYRFRDPDLRPALEKLLRG
jgi:NAD dependent epimerase/dehydratase family enzyme